MIETVIIDVSGITEVLFKKEKMEKFAYIINESETVITPDIYISELTNTLWKYHTAKILSKDECMLYIKDGINLVDKFTDCLEIWQEAFSEGINNKHTVYDMLYMITARRNSSILITNDSVLAGICKKNHIEICN